ncbi:hypothetical protein GQ457_15G004510 [Hibiscus cannabinus]
MSQIKASFDKENLGFAEKVSSERLVKVHVLNHRGEERKRVLNQCYDIKAYSYLADIGGNCEGKPERCRARCKGP